MRPPLPALLLACCIALVSIARGQDAQPSPDSPAASSAAAPGASADEQRSSAASPDEQERAKTLQRLLDSARAALKQRHLDEAQELARQAADLEPDSAQLASLLKQIAAARQSAARREQPASAPTPAADAATLEGLLARADAALARGDYVEPPRENAAQLYRQAQRLSPQNARAEQGLEKTLQGILSQAQTALQAGRLDEAQRLTQQALDLKPESSQAASLKAQITAARDSSTAAPPFGRRRPRNNTISVFEDSSLGEDQYADSVVAIFGNSTSNGEVADSVVAVFGDVRSRGHVAQDVIGVMGNVFVNSRVDHDVVAVLGDIELGPAAVVGGDIILVGGTLTRDPQAVVNGGVSRVFGFPGVSSAWGHQWVQRCLLYGRPLAVGPGLEWAWGLALGFLGFYVLLWLLFPAAIERCVTTFEHHPGGSLVTALATILVIPLVCLLLLITVIGIAALPFLFASLICASLFGKTAILAWIGRRSTAILGTTHPAAHTVLAILVGGAIVLALFCVPVVGLIVFNLLGLLALGVVLYTILLASQTARRPLAPGPMIPPPAPPPLREPPPAAAPTSTAGIAATGAPDAAATATAHASAPASTAPVNLLALPRADFWPRMGALLIDAVLVGILLSSLYERPNTYFMLLAAYGALMWKLKAATVGGLVCGLRVVRVDGRELDWPTVIVRALGCIVSLVVAGLGFIWIAIDENRQGWHDKIAGTLVVRLPPGVAQA